MAFTKLTMLNPHTGQTKIAPVGFSWTSLIFTGFVPLLRGHLIGAFIWFPLAFFTFGFSAIVQGLIYNKLYIQYLIKDGFQVKHSPAPIEHVTNKLNISLPVIAE